MKGLQNIKLAKWIHFSFHIKSHQYSWQCNNKNGTSGKKKLKITLHSALKNIDNNPNSGHNTTLKMHINVQNK
jgi:hypothetical protein